VPLDVSFTDLSSDTPDQWSWNFGDAGISSDQDPNHQFTTPGVFTVSLTATNANGSHTRVMPMLITVGVDASCLYPCGDLDDSGGNNNLIDFALFAKCWNENPLTNSSCVCANLVEYDDHIIDILDLYVFAKLFLDSSEFYPPNTCFTSINEVVINPMKDNTLYGPPKDDRTNGSGVYMFSGNTDGEGLRRGIMAFDTAGNVPEGVTIESVSLTLHVSKSAPGSGSQIHTLHLLEQDWGEGASDAGDPGGLGAGLEDGDASWVYTFYNKDNPESSPEWTSAGGDFSGSASGSQSVGGNGFYTWSSAQMATDVQSWLDSPSTNFGWLIKGNESQSKTAKRFDSRENSNASKRPQLSIVYGQP
jgi:PKD repeat protein